MFAPKRIGNLALAFDQIQDKRRIGIENKDATGTDGCTVIAHQTVHVLGEKIARAKPGVCFSELTNSVSTSFSLSPGSRPEISWFPP